MASPAGPSLPAMLTQALQTGQIPYFLPTQPEYAGLQATYTSNPAQPVVIVRPQNVEHVAAVVLACANGGTPLVIRSGGHDLFGRSTAADAVQLDLRDLKSVEVSADKKTARIGGGAGLDAVVRGLEREGLLTAVGTVGTVGYVGWSTFGGYGPYSPAVGLGVDQIVGAKLVNAEGNVVQADERVIKALRGGGPGNWGVVVELEVKVYPVQELQAGILIFDPTNVRASLTTTLTNLDELMATKDLPPNLYLQPAVLNIPVPDGSGVLAPFPLICYVWAGSADEQSGAWQARIASLGPCVQQAITTTTPTGYMESVTGMIAPRVQGQVETVSVARFSPDVVEALGNAAATMPVDAGSGFTVHPLSAGSPSVAAKAEHEPNSVFRCREPHHMVELIGTSTSPDNAAANSAWAVRVRDELERADVVLEETYFSLTSRERLDLNKLFHEDALAALRALKHELDPKKVFTHALPQL